MAFPSRMMMIFIFASTLVFSFPTLNGTISLDNCRDHCGNINIPFPFGTTSECYHDYTFFVTCDETDSSLPKLFMQDSPLEITDISLDGQLKLLTSVAARDCYARNGTNTDDGSSFFSLPPSFTVNTTANNVIVVGCDALAVATGFRNNGLFSTNCRAQCEPIDEEILGPCKELGCCQINIPEDVWSLEINLAIWASKSCRYAFVVDETAFNFSKESLTSLKDVRELPVVIDWALRDGPCEVAQKNSAIYGCKSPNSECYKPGNSNVYRCRCSHGYQGNPYLVNGCRDIDDCTDISRNDCMTKAHCNNIVGNYTCECPKGYSGNGRGAHGCTKKQDMTIAYFLIWIAFGVVALLLLIILLHMELKRRRSRMMKHKFFLQNGGILLQEKLIRKQRSPDMVQIFNLFELQKATNDFHDNMIIGQGGFGTVCKGLLPGDTAVAIKKSKKFDPSQVEQFINEVLVLSQVNHRNVVRLIGCCLEMEVPLLVYEFINNGTLSAHIHNQAKARFLHWDMRLKIAAETAGVLAYLHSAASTPIIHRDVKPDNILLDHTFTVKVSDFGASKLVPLDLTQLSTMVQGTFGYLDPEYMQTNQLAEKSDVYSFGVVLLELLTGRKAMSFDKPEQEKNLANFFLYVLKQERLFEIVDDNIVGEWNKKQILEVASLAKGCLNVKGEDRPSMKEVAAKLEGLILGEKHSSIKELNNVEEMESLIDKVVKLYAFTNGEGSSTSIGYGSIQNPINGGR